MMLLIKTIMLVLNVSTYIITNITARPIRLAMILVVMSVSTYKTTVILRVSVYYKIQVTSCVFCFAGSTTNSTVRITDGRNDI
jgi:hypothetical protein